MAATSTSSGISSEFSDSSWNPTASSRLVEGERRQLTTLFCDLVGSTELSHRLDPEEFREVVIRYQSAATGVIERFGGQIAKYLGDGVLACFGYPHAHEDDAERAVRSGLSILEAISTLSREHAQNPLSVRIGIHTGPAVIGAGRDGEPDLFGDTPNVAARVQSAAEPHSVFISETTHQLVSGLFLEEGRGAHRLKGVAEPVELYLVLGATGARGRLKLAARFGLTPFVGRDEEIAVLQSRWRPTRDGEGQNVLVIGEPGIGKSRIIQQFRERLGHTPHLWIEGACNPFFQNTPFYPIPAMIGQVLELDKGLDDEESSRLESALQELGLTAVETALVGQMLNLPAGNHCAIGMASPDQVRKQLLASLVKLLFASADAQRLVFALEDLHWADASTLELLQLIAEQGAISPMMLLLSARPEFRAPWPMRAHHAQITLSRLRDDDVREMVKAAIRRGGARASVLIALSLF